MNSIEKFMLFIPQNTNLKALFTKIYNKKIE